MNKDEIMNKIKDLMSNGKLEDAKSFVEEHKDDLGDYYDKAKELVGNNASGFFSKLKNLF